VQNNPIAVQQGFIAMHNTHNGPYNYGSPLPILQDIVTFTSILAQIWVTRKKFEDCHSQKRYALFKNLKSKLDDP